MRKDKTDLREKYDLSNEQYDATQREFDKHLKSRPNSNWDLEDFICQKILEDGNNTEKKYSVKARKVANDRILAKIKAKGEKKFVQAAEHAAMNEIKSAREKTMIEPLQVHYSTEKAVLVKLAIAGQENLKDTWFPKYRVSLDEKGEHVVAIDSYLQKQYGNVIAKQAEIKAAAVGKSVSKEPTKVEEEKTQEKIKIDPLKVVRSTEKAVLVKLPDSTNAVRENGTWNLPLNDTWLPKSRVNLDEKGENVIAVDSFELLLSTNEKAETKNISSSKELAQKLNAQRLANLEKNVPAEMKALPNWCVLKIYKDKATGSYKKFIVNANEPAGGWASSKDSATWTTFDKALEYAKANGGAGLSFAIKGSGYTAFDIDHCYNKETKTYNETAKQYLAALPDSYAEKSVSGTGVHIFTKGSVCENGKYNEARGGAADVEVFETWGFVSMTGDLIDDHHKSLVEMEDNVKRVIQIEVGEKKVYQPQQNNNRNQYHNYAKSDNEVVEKIRNSRKGNEFIDLMNGIDLCGDHSRSDAKLMNILAYFSNSNQAQMQSIFKQSKLYRPEKGDAYVERTAKFAVNSLNQRAQ